MDANGIPVRAQEEDQDLKHWRDIARKVALADSVCSLITLGICLSVLSLAISLSEGNNIDSSEFTPLQIDLAWIVSDVVQIVAAILLCTSANPDIDLRCALGLSWFWILTTLTSTVGLGWLTYSYLLYVLPIIFPLALTPLIRVVLLRLGFKFMLELNRVRGQQRVLAPAARELDEQGAFPAQRQREEVISVADSKYLVAY